MLDRQPSYGTPRTDATLQGAAVNDPFYNILIAVFAGLVVGLLLLNNLEDRGYEAGIQFGQQLSEWTQTVCRKDFFGEMHCTKGTPL